MTNSIVIPGIALLMATALLVIVFGTKPFKEKGIARTFIMLIGFGLLAYGAVGVSGSQGWVDLGTASGYFYTATGVAPSIPQQTTSTTSTNSQSSVQDTKQRIVSTLKISSVKEKYSNAYDTVDGTLRIFDAGTNPSSATANAIDTITISNGAGSSTNAKIKTNTQYRVTFDGDGTYYDQDYGVMTFPEENFNPSTGELGFDMGTIGKVATIDDLINETAIDGTINGQTSNADGSTEIWGNDTVDTITYDESVGDGQYYIEPTISFSGANTEAKNPVLCVEWDTTTPPEGNEISALTYQRTSGSDFGIPSDLIDFWATESCVSLGASQAGGSSSKVKLTVTVDESACDNNADIWYFGVDDLGSLRGKDVNLDTGATLQRIKVDSQA